MGARQSSITFSQAKVRVAQAAGGTSPNEILQAGYAVQAAVQDWNNDEAWAFLSKVGADITIASGTADYDLPADFKYIYSARLADRPLTPLPQKLYDLTVYTTSAGTPLYYNLFKGGLAGSFKITLIPTPDAAGTLSLKYQRAIDVPDSDADILDIPQDYEGYLLAQAKYLYLLDKGGDSTRIQGWKEFYEAGKRKAMAAETRRPNEDKYLIPEAAIPLNTTGLDIPDIIYQGD